MTDLSEFLLARIADDESRARKATQGKWRLWGMSVMADRDGTSNVGTALDVAHTSHESGVLTFNAHHIAHWGPARVLAECEAKRRIVELATGPVHRLAEQAAEAWGIPHEDTYADENLLRLLTLPYTDHPDYREEWRS